LPPLIALDRHLGALLGDAGWRAALAASVRPFVEAQRWFTGKARRVSAVDLADWGQLPGSAPGFIVLLDVAYVDGGTERFFVPLGAARGAAAERLLREAPAAVVARSTLEGDGVLRVLHGLIEDGAVPALLRALTTGTPVPLARGTIAAAPTRALADLLGDIAPDALSARRVSGEQSNSSFVFGDRLIMKVVRRLQPGVNPDFEVGRHLTEHSTYTGVPRLAGGLEYVGADGRPTTLAVAHALVAGGHDAWEMSVARAHAWLSDVARQGASGGAPADYTAWATLLGRRTAELHLALASAHGNPAFVPEPIGHEGLVRLAGEMRDHGAAALDVLARAADAVPAALAADVERVLTHRDALLDRLGAIVGLSPALARIRVHGDFHLGQVLATPGEVAIIDFEGEPLRPIEERRAKQLAVKDVAGMLRSFSYAAYAAAFALVGDEVTALARLEPAALAFDAAAGGAFLAAYRATAADAPFLPAGEAAFDALLAAHLTDKALYELVYELNNRPAWLRIPLRGVLGMIDV